MEKNKILEKIKNQKIEMKPKLYFILRTIILILAFVLIFLFIVFLISFIIFSLQARGVWYFSDFGFRGFGLFLGSFPWILVLIAIVLVILLEVFAKKTSFVYKKPLLYSVLGIFVIVLLIGGIVAKTPMHKDLFMSAQEGRLPVFGPVYRGEFVNPPRNIYSGVVFDISEDGFTLDSKEAGMVSVLISSETKTDNAPVREGDFVIVMGERNNGEIRAFGIHKAGEDNMFQFRYKGSIKNILK